MRKCKYEIDPNRIIEMYQSGLSLAQIADKTGIPAVTVRRRFNSLGFQLRPLKEALRLSAKQGKLREAYNRRYYKGSNHPRWKGGRTKTQRGYIIIRGVNDPSARKDSTILEHIYVYKQHYGSIPTGYDIHHLNGIKDDNRIENLVALPSKVNRASSKPSKLLIEQLQKRIRELEDHQKQLKLTEDKSDHSDS